MSNPITKLYFMDNQLKETNRLCIPINTSVQISLCRNDQYAPVIMGIQDINTTKYVDLPSHLRVISKAGSSWIIEERTTRCYYTMTFSGEYKIHTSGDSFFHLIPVFGFYIRRAQNYDNKYKYGYYFTTADVGLENRLSIPLNDSSHIILTLSGEGYRSKAIIQWLNATTNQVVEPPSNIIVTSRKDQTNDSWTICDRTDNHSYELYFNRGIEYQILNYNTVIFNIFPTRGWNIIL